MKLASSFVIALVAVSASAVERKRVLRAPIHSSVESNIDEFKSMFDAEGAAAEAMEAFGRFLQSSASGASLPPITSAPKAADISTPAPTTTPVTAKPTEAPVPAPEPTDPPTESSANVVPITEPDSGTTDPDEVVETTAGGGGVAIPLLSVLGVVGIASLVIARRTYLASANSDGDSASSDSQESSQEGLQT